MKRIIYYFRSFKTLNTVAEAEKMKLYFRTNVYGDGINHLNCRSLWNDKYWNIYRCNELKLK